MELLIVIIIIGILAAIALPNFGPMKEQALDKEAIASVKLIRAAERIYRMETNNYVACANTSAVNSNLKLAIPTGNPNWNYVTVADNTATPSTCCAQATRNVTDGRTWRIRNTEEDPVADGTCP